MRALVVVLFTLASCVRAPSAESDAGFTVDAGHLVDAGHFVDAGITVRAGTPPREPPYSVGKAHCVAKATARANARPGGVGNIGYEQGCPSWVDRRVLPPKANGGVGALEHGVTSSQRREGGDVCCYFGAPFPP